MIFDFKQIFSATLVLFAVIDVIGSIPVILDIKNKSGGINELRVSIVSLAIMVCFLFLGESIIELLGIDVYSFSVAGSFVLFFLALEMILGVELFKSESVDPKISSVVPIAFPILAGAGTLTSILALRGEFARENILIAILINVLFIFIVLKLTRRLEKLLGPGGLLIIKKVFGIILLAIAVRLFGKNIGELI
ncbi:MAG: MarC family protein [Bacteroidota bacterium]